MKAVVITDPGGPEVLKLQEVETPVIGENEVLIKVAATALNRADTLQRQGKYPPPPGASLYPGLECSGVIEAVGKHVARWKIGDQVCALLAGGGYAEKVAVPAGQVLPVPAGISLKDAASLPEVACTVWSTVFMMSRLSAGETFLVHGGSSGIGTFAIQIAKYKGAKVFVTAGSEEKLAFCKDLGADVCINYKTEDFVARVTEETGGKGVDVILDNIGGPYFQKNINSLSIDGRLFLLGFQGGPVAEVNLAFILARRLTVQGAGLRTRTLENKAAIVSEVEEVVWPAIAEGKVKPVVYKSFPLSEAAEAHQLMESSKHIGAMASRGKGVYVEEEMTQEEMHQREQQASRNSKYPYRGGPSTPEVLTDYEGHIARQIFEERKERTLLNCVNHWSLVQVNNSTEYWHYSEECSRFQELFFSTGLKNLVDCNFQYLDRALISAFVERWHPETSSFHMPWGEMTITPRDVSELLGLPIKPEFLLTPKNFNHESARNLVRDVLGKDEYFWTTTLYKDTQGFTVTESQLREHFKLQCNEADENSIRCCVKAYCLYVLCCTAASNKSSNRISLMWLCALSGGFGDARRGEHLNISDYGWGMATLTVLYTELGKASRSKCAGIAGYLTLLQAWIYMHFPDLRASVDDSETYDPVMGDPGALQWVTKKIRRTSEDLIMLRKRIDMMPIQQVVFQPYLDTDVHQFNFFHGVIYWLENNAPYLPDRVLRQFGYQQVIPEPPLPCFDTRRPANPSDFKHCYKLIQALALTWRNHCIHEKLAATGIPTDSSDASVEYLDWYRRVSHVRVHPPQPVGANDHIWQTGVKKAIGELRAALRSANPSGKPKKKESAIERLCKAALGSLLGISCYNDDAVSSSTPAPKPSKLKALVIREEPLDARVPPAEARAETSSSTESEERPKVYKRVKKTKKNDGD